MKSNPRGKYGENFAAETLKTLGYVILERNYSSRYGEIDIIATLEDTICFVEVKARRRDAQVSGSAAVTRQKQKRIIATALMYLQRNPSGLQPRFDVFSIVTRDDRQAESYDFLTGAFDSAAYYNR